MSVNTPPNPNVATFNNLYWISDETALTTAEANKKYLKFPVAQGAETLKAITVNGDATFTSVNPPVSTATQPLANDSSTKMPTTAWVQTAVTAAPAKIPIADNNTNSLFYPTFTTGVIGNKTELFIDSLTTPFSYNPNTGDFNVASTLKIATGSNNQVAVGKAAGLTTQGTSAVAIGSNAGQTTQGQNAVAVGLDAGNSGQGANSIAIGNSAGQNTQSNNAVAVGINAGQTTQGVGSVAVGQNAGQTTQGPNAVAVGLSAGQTSQSQYAVAIGFAAGNNSQKIGSVAIGTNSGLNTAGSYSVCLGYQAGQGTVSAIGDQSIAIGLNAGQNSQSANSICLNATGSALNPNQVNSFFVKPIRNDSSAQQALQYNTTSGEISYTTPLTIPYTPRFANYSDYQSGTTGYSQGTKIGWTGTWGVNDYVMIRITAQGQWGVTGATGWDYYATTFGSLILRPYWVPVGTWSSSASNPAYYTLNSNNSNIGNVKKAIYYTSATNSGTQNLFYMYGQTSYIELGFLAPGLTGGWAYTHLIEYITHSSSGGTITFTNGTGTNSTNNTNP